MDWVPFWNDRFHNGQTPQWNFCSNFFIPHIPELENWFLSEDQKSNFSKKLSTFNGNRLFIPNRFLVTQPIPPAKKSRRFHQFSSSSRPKLRARTSVRNFFNNEVNRLQYSILSLRVFFFHKQNIQIFFFLSFHKNYGNIDSRIGQMAPSSPYFDPKTSTHLRRYLVNEINTESCDHEGNSTRKFSCAKNYTLGTTAAFWIS